MFIRVSIHMLSTYVFVLCFFFFLKKKKLYNSLSSFGQSMGAEDLRKKESIVLYLRFWLGFHFGYIK